MFDLVFKNARVFDGTGAPWFRADVAVKDGSIVEVGKTDESAKKTVDAQGRYLCPGFIDAHSHSDRVLPTNPTADSKVMQGVTLEVVGQCGSSAAPRALGYRPDEDDALGQPHALDWTDVDSYLKLLEHEGVSVNVAFLVGHGSVRRQVMGTDNRPPSSKELSLMKRLVSDAMDQGAFGMSTGLIYVPGTYAKTDEVLELAKIVGDRRGIYFTHMRNEEDDLINALKETIKIGFEADIPVQVSHFKVKEKRNWGKVKKAIDLIEKAREEGLDITADQYPYTASSTGLRAALPSWVWAAGTAKALQSFGNPSVREEIIQAISDRAWPNLVIADLENEEDLGFIGKSIKEVAEILGLSPEDACLNLLHANDGAVQIVNFAMCEDDVATVMTQPWVMVGSDGSALNAQEGKGQPHPRNYGTFSRVIARYVREKKVLRLEEAIRKMTSLPAMRLGLQDRGILRQGMKADLVLFDYGKIRDRATFIEPHQYAQGIDWVVVNGVMVVEKGCHTGNRPGQVLRHI